MAPSTEFQYKRILRLIGTMDEEEIEQTIEQMRRMNPSMLEAPVYGSQLEATDEEIQRQIELTPFGADFLFYEYRPPKKNLSGNLSQSRSISPVCEPSEPNSIPPVREPSERISVPPVSGPSRHSSILLDRQPSQPLTPPEQPLTRKRKSIATLETRPSEVESKRARGDESQDSGDSKDNAYWNRQAEELIKSAFIKKAFLDLRNVPKNITTPPSLRSLNMEEVNKLVAKIQIHGDLREDYPLVFLVQPNNLDTDPNHPERAVFCAVDPNIKTICVAGNHRLHAATILHDIGLKELEDAKQRAGKVPVDSERAEKLNLEVERKDDTYQQLRWWPVKLYNSGAHLIYISRLTMLLIAQICRSHYL